MKKIDDPFLAVLPYIDLHGLTIVEAMIKTREFINDNLKLKNYKVVIIHGKGTNKLKINVHEYLKYDKRVISYKLDNFNDGVTIVELEGDDREK